MAAKKKTTALGPKAKLMKSNVDTLKRKAKRLKVAGFSTKKKEQLVNSIMMAEARAKRKPGVTRKKKVVAKKPMMAQAQPPRGARPNMPMRKPVRTSVKSGVSISPKRKRPMARPMMADKYNGWSNYETWLMNLWYDQYFYELVMDQYGEDVTNDDQGEIADMLEDSVDELILQGHEDLSGFAADMVNQGLRRVDYYEIADAVIDSVKG